MAHPPVPTILARPLLNLTQRSDMKITLSPELERLIAERVSSGRYRSADEVVREGLDLLKQRDDRENGQPTAGGPDFAAAFQAASKGVPESAWEKVPTDLSRNIDSYLYGFPKKS